MQPLVKDDIPSVASPRPKPVPQNLIPVARHIKPGVDRFTFGAEALEYSNTALLEHCDYTPEFGGHVARVLAPAGHVVVTVYTD